jgi:thiosulfate reductase cytochrome b subunit
MTDPGTPSRRQGLPRQTDAVQPENSLPTPTPQVRRGLPSVPDAAPAATEPTPVPALATRPATRPIRKRMLWTLGGVIAAAIVVVIAKVLMGLSDIQSFVQTYPGATDLPVGAPVGIPAWLGWQHFFNVFLMILIVRTGWRVRTEQRPQVFWTPRWKLMGTAKVSLNIWFHQSLDLLWLINGVVFIVLLFATGQWMRIVPTSWEIFPNAVSAALQYASFDWPTENGWVNYNSLQVLAYFVTVFIAAPLAIVTGVRMSGVWPTRAVKLNRAYPIEVARAIHLPVMFYFVAFIIVHVLLVMTTGALRNLNHMYASQDDVSWLGFGIFVMSLLTIVGAWFAARPVVIAPIARLFGKVGR